MLSRLSVRDVVLIEKLDLDFAGGLCVFTGETGAGKSILLDSLALATGARSDAALVRRGCKQLSVTAEFSLPDGHEVFKVLDEHEIELESGEPLVLRRIVTADGKSKAFVNDQSVSAGLLRKIGDLLIEIHGQFATHGLLNPATHKSVLDAYGGLQGRLDACRAAYKNWRAKAEERQKAEERLQKAKDEEDFLRHSVDELVQFAPQPGEDEELSQRRSLMMNSEKLIEGLNTARDALFDRSVDKSLRQAERALESLSRLIEGRFEPIIEALDRAVTELNEAGNMLEEECRKVELDPREQEQVEERLFALRALARKHQTTPDELPGLLSEYQRQLASLDKGAEDLIRLTKEEESCRIAYEDAAKVLSAARKEAAKKLDAAVMKELPPLKLGKASFLSIVEELPQTEWNADGIDKVQFAATTNPGQPAGAINKIASGGELARFMLALKVNLAQAEGIPTLIFDEVDTGIGGATATAVGERLERLAGEDCQVLAITHSPQVASFGAHHFKVSKAEDETGRTLTAVCELTGDARREEIARMLSGASITEASRAAADELLKGRI